MTCNSLKIWSGREDLNLRPPAPHAGALPGCATPRTAAHHTAMKKAGTDLKSVPAACAIMPFSV